MELAYSCADWQDLEQMVCKLETQGHWSPTHIPRDGHNFQGGTKDRECPPRYLVSLRTYPQLRDPAGGPGAAVQSRSQVPLVFYTGQGGAVSLWAWNTLLRGAGKPPACLGKARAAGIRWQSQLAAARW